MNIFDAARKGNLTELESLLKNKADVNAKDNNGHCPIFISANDSQFCAVKALIEAGANLDIQTINMQWTPLFAAANTGNSEIVRILLEAGANPNIQNKSGETALHKAIDKGDNITAQLLLAHGVNIDLQNSAGQTALYIAANQNNREMIETLTKAGANPKIQTTSGHVPSDVANEENKTFIRDYATKYTPRENKHWAKKISAPIKKYSDIASSTAKNLDNLDKILGRAGSKIMGADTAAATDRWVFMPPALISHVTGMEEIGYHLTEIFNFGNRRYISTLQNLQTGFETAEQKSFDDIKDKTVLELALDEFKKAGGKADPHVIDTGFHSRKKEPLTPPSLTPPSPGTGG